MTFSDILSLVIVVALIALIAPVLVDVFGAVVAFVVQVFIAYAVACVIIGLLDMLFTRRAAR